MTWPDQSKAEAQEREHLKVAMPSTATSLVGLFTGLALGILIEVGFLEFLAPLAVLIEPLGTVWSRALQMVVFPLAVANIVAGIPVEGIVLIEAVDVIPDIFKTLLNTTGYMTVSVILCRLAPSRSEPQPVPE